jgi:hypothetical protein
MKKILFIVLTAATALGCNEGGTKIGLEDSRPKSEKALIREINIADSTYKAQINEITKREAYDKSIKNISNFILNHTKAEGWEAKVQSIDLDEFNAIIIDLIIAKGIQFDDELPEYESVVLRSRISDDDRLKTSVKPLQKGDDVVVSGSFLTNKNADGNLEFDSYTDARDDHDIISNPVFRFNITDIKKK